ncbi:MAG: MOSC domain-containing protein [Chloroflexi bacterium]|nr:MOSC domain-containing protein [Chloroflexota bacterium]
MKLLSINVSRPKAVDINGRTYLTGIYKQHRMGRVFLRRLGLDGDGQGDPKNHGGPHQAVYCYPHEHYAHWAAELGWTDSHYGAFGENLTLLGLLESSVCIGDVFRIGGAVIQVSQPRVPCYKLADKLGVPGFEKTFLRANRVGFYARVLEEGVLEAGDPILQLEKDPVGMTVAEVNAALYLGREDRATAERARRIESLSPEWRSKFEKLLAKR